MKYCENKELNYLPYPIKNEIFIDVICFFCKKYYYSVDRNLIIPDNYKNLLSIENV